MANANPSIDQYVDDHDLEMIQVCDPHEQADFDEWYVNHSIGQLFDAHSGPELRWEIIHWVFTVPFVSREYADIALYRILEGAVQRFKDSVQGNSEAVDPTMCCSVDVPSLNLVEVAFQVTPDFRIIPYSYSFEAVCRRLGVDPEEVRDGIRYQMHRKGIDRLIENNATGVSAKCAPPSCKQQDLIDLVDYSDVKVFISPIAVPGLVKRQKPFKKVAVPQAASETLDLFA